MAVLLLVLIIQSIRTLLLFQLSLSVLPAPVLVTKEKALLTKIDWIEISTVRMKLKSPMCKACARAAFEAAEFRFRYDWDERELVEGDGLIREKIPKIKKKEKKTQKRERGGLTCSTSIAADV